MLTESLMLYDGMTTVDQGMDSGHSPSLLSPTQVALLVNATTRQGFPESRPGRSQLTLTGDSLQLGRFQGASSYYAPDGRGYLITSVGGQILRIDPFHNVVTTLSNASTSNPSNLPKVWFCQAESFLAIQDNSSIPLVYDGSVLRRTKPVDFGGDEFPIGNAMEYNNGRLWVALRDRRTFSGGDLAYSVTGQAKDVLTSTQNKFLTGGAFVLPSSAGLITAMRSLAVQDSVLGQGPLVVFGEFAAATVNAPFNADEWQTTASPIATIGLIAPGPTSQEACIPVNGDLWYRAVDGDRSFMIARRDHGTFVNTPVSNEIRGITDVDEHALLAYASAVDFDNRRLETVSPWRVVDSNRNILGIAWRGLSVLDFRPITNMFDRTQPSWDGVWTGLDILQVVTLKNGGKDHCYIFAINSTTLQIELWELSTQDRYDNSTTPITWIIETRNFGFPPNGSEVLKELVRSETWLKQITGTVPYTIYYRPDDYQSWLMLDTGTFSATGGMCSVNCSTPIPPMMQYRPRKLSQGPTTDDECCVNKLFRSGYEFQFRLEIGAPCELRRFRAVAQSQQEEVVGGCLRNESGCLETGLPAGWYPITPPYISPSPVTPVVMLSLLADNGRWYPIALFEYEDGRAQLVVGQVPVGSGVHEYLVLTDTTDNLNYRLRLVLDGGLVTVDIGDSFTNPGGTQTPTDENATPTVLQATLHAFELNLVTDGGVVTLDFEAVTT